MSLRRGVYIIVMYLAMVASSAWSASFTACGVDFSPPWFAIPSASTPLGYLFVVDTNGDIFLGATSATFNTTVSALSNALLIFSNPLAAYVLAINASDLYLHGTVIDHATSIPKSNALVFNTPSGPVASITAEGNVYAKGYAVYAGAQAGCPPDGLYCDTDAGDIYWRDYYCDSTTWNCSSTSTLYEDCNDNAYDSDNGDLYEPGVCKDYDLCSSGDTQCPPPTSYRDTCVGGTVVIGLAYPPGSGEYYDTLREYYATQSSCYYEDINVYSCTFVPPIPNKRDGYAIVTVCDSNRDGGWKEEITVLKGCCSDSNCPSSAFIFDPCDGVWRCVNHQCTCEMEPPAGE